MHSALCPSLYQINTRVWLTELSHSLGRLATLDDIPDAELHRLSRMGSRRTSSALRPKEPTARYYAANQSQLYVRLPAQDGGGRLVRFEDLTGAACFDRDRHDLGARRLYLDMPHGATTYSTSSRSTKRLADERLPATLRAIAYLQSRPGTARGSRPTLP